MMLQAITPTISWIPPEKQVFLVNVKDERLIGFELGVKGLEDKLTLIGNTAKSPRTVGVIRIFVAPVSSYTMRPDMSVSRLSELGIVGKSRPSTSWELNNKEGLTSCCVMS